MGALFQAIDPQIATDVEFIAALKDDAINPLIQEQVATLNVMAEQIVHSHLDGDLIKARVERVHRTKQELAVAINPALRPSGVSVGEQTA